MSRYPIGRGVKVEVQNAAGSTKSISAITQASPGVATSTAHALANGSVGYITGVSGMTPLEGQAVRLANQATNTFELEGLSTVPMPAFSGTATFTPISTWHLVGNSIDVTTEGGAASDVQMTTLADEIEQNDAGPLSAQSVSFTGRSAFQTAAMLAIEAAAYAGTPLVFRITFKNGEQRIFRATPDVSSEAIPLGGSVTGTFRTKVAGRVLRLPAL